MKQRTPFPPSSGAAVDQPGSLAPPAAGSPSSRPPPRPSVAAAAPSRPAPAKASSLLTRTLTIVGLGPLLFLAALHSKESCTVLVGLGVLIAAVEWSGLKRHLKVALLVWGGGGVGVGEAHVHPLTGGSGESWRGAGGLAAAQSGDCGSGKDGGASVQGLTATPLLRPSPPQSPLLPNGEPLRPSEYAMPITPVSSYTVLKGLGWAGLALAAYYGANAYMVTLTIYFLIFVCVTLMAHNRLEMKIEKAVSGMARHSQSTTANQVRPNQCTSAEEAKASVKRAQRDYFLSLELRMIVEKQPTEQFLDFCLDIFGMVWISGMVYPIFYYDVPRVGVPWAFSTLLGNFLNDIMALLVGRSLKKVRQHYACVYDLSSTPSAHVQQQASSDAGLKKLAGEPLPPPQNLVPLSKANPVLRFVLRGPHQLYPAISPNKSTEGAIAGVLTNAVSFAAVMHVFYTCVYPPPDASFIAPDFQSVPLWLLVGFALGVLGVVGDLLQSLLKRAAFVQDAGFIVPGHGGVLDRFDGALMSFPFVFCVMSVLHGLSQS